jgi:PAS domain S-box-containing protein
MSASADASHQVPQLGLDQLILPAFLLERGEISYFNNPFVQWLGVTDADVQGAHPVRHSAQIQQDGLPAMDFFNQQVEVAFKRGLSQFEWIFRGKSGKEKHVDISMSVFDEEAGALLCVIHDTERFYLRHTSTSHTLQRYRRIFDLSPDPVWLLRANNFVDCNQAAVTVLGYPDRASLLNKHPSELSPPIQPDGEESFAKANRMGKLAWQHGSHKFEWVHRRCSGELFWAEVVLAPIELDFQSYTFCAWRDVTSRKQHEDMLMAIIADLQEKLESAHQVK